jgi:hypothetical protein
MPNANASAAICNAANNASNANTKMRFEIQYEEHQHEERGMNAE